MGVLLQPSGGGKGSVERALKMQNPGGDFIETHLIQTAIRSEMVMLIAAEVNRGMRAARLALQKGEQTLLHGESRDVRSRALEHLHATIK